MRTIHSLLLALIPVTAASLSAQTVYYTETFPNSGSASLGVGSAGWQTFVTSSATDRSTNTNAANGFLISTQIGFNGSGGYLSTTLKDIGLTFTDEFTAIDRSLTEIVTLSMATNNANTSDTYRFAIQIDVSGTPTWYATDATFTQTTSGAHDNFETNGEIKTFNFTTDGSAWRELTFTAGSELSLAASTISGSLPSGDLLAAGVYNDLPTGTLRWDQYEIAVVPEPAAAALLFGGLAFLFCLRRRR